MLYYANHYLTNDIKLKLLYKAEEVGGMGHWLLDLRDESLYWSERVYAIHGVQADEYEPDLQTAVDFYHPDDRETVHQMIKQAIVSAAPFQFTLRIIRPDQSVIPVESHAMVECDPEGGAIMIYGLFRMVSPESSPAT